MVEGFGVAVCARSAAVGDGEEGGVGGVVWLRIVDAAEGWVDRCDGPTSWDCGGWIGDYGAEVHLAGAAGGGGAGVLVWGWEEFEV